MLRPKTIFHILLIFLFVLSCSSSNDKPLVAPPKEKVSLPKLWGFAMDDFNEGKAEGAIEKFKMKSLRWWKKIIRTQNGPQNLY